MSKQKLVQFNQRITSACLRQLRAYAALRGWKTSEVVERLAEEMKLGECIIAIQQIQADRQRQRLVAEGSHENKQ